MEDTRNQIILAAMAAVRQQGLEGVRIQHIAEQAGLSAGAMYRYFESKDALMEACFFYVDRQVAAIFDDIKLNLCDLASNPEQEIKRLWMPYFRFWTSHPDETVFYHRFRDSASFPEFDRNRDVSYFGTFVGMIHIFYQYFTGLEQISPTVLWFHILTVTVLYAKNVVEGVIPNTEETADMIFRLLIRGLQEYLRSEDAL